MTESNNSVENSATSSENASVEGLESLETEGAETVPGGAPPAETASSVDDADSSSGKASGESENQDASFAGSPAAFDSLELEPEDDVPSESPATDANSTAPPNDALALEVQSLTTQLEERNSQYLRITADFENFRKRTRKEQEELGERAKCSTILELLPVIDNFERARAQIKAETEEAANIHKSYQGIYKQLVECLKRVGVVPMRAKGKEFDPMLHEAVMREPSSEFEDGIVIEELQRGYLLGERVLRHAMVKVAVAVEPEASNEISEEEEASPEA